HRRAAQGQAAGFAPDLPRASDHPAESAVRKSGLLDAHQRAAARGKRRDARVPVRASAQARIPLPAPMDRRRPPHVGELRHHPQPPRRLRGRRAPPGQALPGHGDEVWPLSLEKRPVPVIPGNFYAAGLNYRAHIEWANRAHGTSYKVPERADIGYRSNNALVGSGEDIVIPRDSSGQVDFEGELVAVIGKRAKNVSEKEALDYVAGYTLGNDVSERSWQRSDRTLWRAKNSDTFKPMGPRIVSGIDPMNQVIEVRVNGRTVSSYNTS